MAKPVHFAIQGCQRGSALRELAEGRIVLDIFEHGGRRQCPDVGAGALGIVRQAHTSPGILFANRGLQKEYLTRCIVNQRGKDLAHKILVVQRDIPELLPVQNGGGIGQLHASIVTEASGPRNRRKTLVIGPKELSLEEIAGLRARCCR